MNSNSKCLQLLLGVLNQVCKSFYEFINHKSITDPRILACFKRSSWSNRAK